jgi:hypothetical protein
MTLTFSVEGLPPKKDGANSMWRKGSELGRLKALRLAASQAMAGRPPFSSLVQLKVTIHADPESGDLDNFIAGICDGLMAAHPATPIDSSEWSEVPPDSWPSRAIAFTDDAAVSLIQAQRVPPEGEASRYKYKVEVSEYRSDANAVSA